MSKQDAHNDGVAPFSINERQRRESVLVSVSMLRYASAESTTSSIMETRPSTVPHDSATGHAVWHCYAAFASREAEGGGGRKGEKEGEARAKEAARIVGAPTKALERLARLLCVRVQWRKPQCIISRNGTLTPSVFLRSLVAASRAAQSDREDALRPSSDTREADKSRREITSRREYLWRDPRFDCFEMFDKTRENADSPR